MRKKQAHRKRASVTTYTLSRRQLLWLFLCFLIVGGAAIWLGLGLAPYVIATIWWRITLAQLPLFFAYVVMFVLLLQMARQARRQASLLKFVDDETGETFTPVGEEMEV